MKPNTKYALIAPGNVNLGYFLKNKFYPIMFDENGYDAELKSDGYVYQVGEESPIAKIKNLSYTRLKDSNVFELIKIE